MNRSRAPERPVQWTVLVHPHWRFHNSARHLLGPLAREAVKIPPLAHFRQSPTAGDYQQQDLLHRFYRKEIDRIQKTPGARLLIVRHSAHTPLPWRFPSPRYSAGRLRQGDSRDDLGAYAEAALVSYAKKHLGRRLTVTLVEPHQVGRFLAAAVPAGHLKAPVRVFGEIGEHCVFAAADTLRRAGFTKVRRLSSKSA